MVMKKSVYCYRHIYLLFSANEYLEQSAFGYELRLISIVVIFFEGALQLRCDNNNHITVVAQNMTF